MKQVCINQTKMVQKHFLLGFGWLPNATDVDIDFLLARKGITCLHFCLITC